MSNILVGRRAPDFVAPAVFGNGSIVEDFRLSDMFKSSYVLLFFWPMDFTFVCPSEIIAYNNRLDQFREREVALVGVSVDSQYTHYAWRNTSLDKGGIGHVGFPMVADLSHEITRAYGVEHESGVALRATFLIDRSGVVQYQVVNNLSLGRDPDESLRMVDALQHVEKQGEVCPAGWKRGKEGMKGSPEGVAEYLVKYSDAL